MNLNYNKERTEILYNDSISSIRIFKKKYLHTYFIPFEIPIKKHSYWKGEEVIVGWETINGRFSNITMCCPTNFDKHIKEYKMSRSYAYKFNHKYDLQDFKNDMNEDCIYELISEQFDTEGNYKIFTKPNLEIQLENNGYVNIVFNTEEEMNDYLDKLIIKIGKPYIVI